ncbi:uncharacterized protein LOC117287060 [Fukomys damarensis]|uniref:uncharacterized protein LOC117287060 n=1 Tax=Fukomys damarensis TaxID=885580 RepID=UPI0014559DCD|nr:uncharacterized protein LOC117287060 [Fukomys damarensis]
MCTSVSAAVSVLWASATSGASSRVTSRNSQKLEEGDGRTHTPPSSEGLGRLCISPPPLFRLALLLLSSPFDKWWDREPGVRLCRSGRGPRLEAGFRLAGTGRGAGCARGSGLPSRARPVLSSYSIPFPFLSPTLKGTENFVGIHGFLWLSFVLNLSKFEFIQSQQSGIQQNQLSTGKYCTLRLAWPGVRGWLLGHRGGEYHLRGQMYQRCPQAQQSLAAQQCLAAPALPNTQNKPGQVRSQRKLKGNSTAGVARSFFEASLQLRLLTALGGQRAHVSALPVGWGLRRAPGALSWP